jgi:hypothetical protein
VDRLWEGRPQGGVGSIVGSRERRELELIARDPVYPAAVRPQQAHGAGHDRVEYRLDIRLRAADDAQDVAGGGLLVERRGELAVAPLELGEEAHVLDGDHGLIRESPEQRDLVLGEWDRLSTDDVDGTDRGIAAEHGYADNAANASDAGALCEVGMFVIVLRVGDGDYAAPQNSC